MVGSGLHLKHFCKTLVGISGSNQAMNGGNFQFSHYKSMETLCCHSNQSSHLIGTKIITFEEAKMSMPCMKIISFIPLMVFEEKNFEYFTKQLRFMSPWQPIKFRNMDKIYTKHRGLLNKHFCKKIQISPLRKKKMHMSTFPIISLW